MHNTWSFNSKNVSNLGCDILSLRLTNQMLVSGTMSESETTSSFPDRLAELSKGPSASKLKQRKGD